MEITHTDKILVLDLGSEHTQVLAQKLRELGVYCEVWSWQHDMSDINAFAPKGIVLSAGKEADFRDLAQKLPDAVFAQHVPVLAVGSAMAVMAIKLGGGVEHAPMIQTAVLQSNHPLLTGLAGAAKSIKTAGDWTLSHLPKGFTQLAATPQAVLSVIANEAKKLYAVPFHPEAEKGGETLLSEFVRHICGCEATWTSANIIARQMDYIRDTVGDDQVLLALSGGVDSSVVATLLHQAIGEQLTCVFVDTGLMRFKEGDEVMASVADHMGVNVVRVNAQARYFEALEGVSDPEQKRKIIGQMFITIFEDEAAKLEAGGKQIKWLAQGTIYPDVIESAGTGHGVIKSHHNVGGLPERMQLKLIEPLRPLFKDEVRRIGVKLGLPEKMVYRHPFPGPGLGVRIIGEIKPEYADILQRADAIFIEELRKADWYNKVSQAFAIFIPVKSVGVIEEKRSYEWVIGLRAVETIDFMTARWAQLPYDLLGKVSNRIITELTQVSRVVYDISGKPPATIEWE